MTDLFVFLFFTIAAFVYSQDREGVEPGARALVVRIVLCAIVGLVCTLLMLSFVNLSGIDPNAGQRM